MPPTTLNSEEPNYPTRSNPAQVEGRILGLLRHRRSLQLPRGSHQRSHRARKTNRQRLPQPHQLSTPNAPHSRRPRCLHSYPTLQSSLVLLLLRIFADAFFRSSQTLKFRFHFIWFGCNVTDFLTLIVSPCPG